MGALIEAARLIGVMLLVGGLCYSHVFRFDAGQAGDAPAKRCTRAMAAGLFVILIGGLAVGMPLTASIQAAFGMTAIAAHSYSLRTGSTALRILSLTAATGVLGMQAFASHAASEPGALPVVSSALHGLAAAAWGGTLLHIAIRPRRADAANALLPGAITSRRFVLFSVACLALLALSGGLLAFVHIHNADALATTPYGSAYRVKVLFAVLLSLVIAWRLARIGRSAVVPGPEHQVSQPSWRAPTVDVVLLAGLVFASALLASRQPPGLAPFLNPQSFTVGVGELPFDVRIQPVAGQVSKARLEFVAEASNTALPDASTLRFSTFTVAGDAGVFDIDALPVGPSTFLGETVFAVPGRWTIELTLTIPGQESMTAVHAFTLPAPPLRQDMHAYLNASTIAWSRAHAMTFAVGLVLLLVSAWSMRMCWQRRTPAWLMPFGFLNVALGGFLILSVTFVKTYPGSFRSNPVPYTSAAIRDGGELYGEHCAECHGIAGNGDGPWAIAERGSIPDLTSAHIDTHTDGEVYWWISYGIPSLDMPALADALSEEERWTVINFVRSLRHGLPPE